MLALNGVNFGPQARGTMIQLVRLVAPLAAGAALSAACGYAGAMPAGETPTAQATGQIQGQVLRGPGSDPRAGGAGAAVPVPGDPVEVRSVDGKLVTTAVTATDGSFRIDAAGGTYTVVESICSVKQQVEVRPQAVIQLTLAIPNSC